MIQMFRPNRKNPLIPLIITITIILLTGILIFYSFFTSQGHVGESLTSLTTKKAYTFSRIETTPFQQLDVKWRSPVTVAPLYNEEEVLKGIAVLGEGNFHFKAPDGVENRYESIQSAYIPMTQKTWDFISLNGDKEEAFLSANELQTIHQLIEKRSFLYLSVTFFGHERFFIADEPAGHYVLAATKDQNWLKYRETDTIEFQQEQQKPLIYQANAEITKPAWTGLSLAQWMMIAGLSVSAFLLTYVASVQFTQPRITIFGSSSYHHPHALYFFVSFGAFLLFEHLASPEHLIYGYSIAITLLLLAFLPYLLHRDTAYYLGIGGYNLFSASFTAIVLALIFQWIGSLQLPKGFEWQWGSQILTFIWVYPIMSLLHETYWRGVLQNLLIRWTNGFFGILFTVIFSAVYTYVQLVIFQSAVGDELYLQAFLFAPIYAAILGYFYWKTSNLWATALLHMLMVWLPTVTIY